jgi:uncharacterized membrane protein
MKAKARWKIIKPNNLAYWEEMLVNATIWKLWETVWKRARGVMARGRKAAT